MMKQMRIIAGAASLALLAGCVSAERQPPIESPPLPPANAACDAAAASAVVGRLARVEVTEEAQRLSGAETVRVIGPGQPVTQDYRPDRLNLETDAQNVITNVRCG